jgi:hypothetical protein
MSSRGWRSAPRDLTVAVWVTLGTLTRGSQQTLPNLSHFLTCPVRSCAFLSALRYHAGKTNRAPAKLGQQMGPNQESAFNSWQSLR